jgi:hypothetical protein
MKFSSFELYSDRDIPLPASDTSSCDSTQDKGQPEENHQPLLGVRLTGFYLLNTTLTLVYGIWKAIISSYRGQPVIPTTLELIFGTPVALVYVLIIQARALREAEKVDPVQIIPRQSGGTWRNNAQRSAQVSSKSIGPLPF